MTLARQPSRAPRRPVPVPARPRLHAVRGRPVPDRRPPRRRIVWAVAGTAFVLLVLVSAQVLLGQAGFKISTLEGRVDQKRLRAEQLQIDVQRLRSPERIASRATKLGMVPAGDVIVLTASPSPVRGPASRRGAP